MSSDRISEFNRDSLRRIAREIVIRRFVLILHALIYICVNTLLFFINLAVNFRYPWFLWSVTGWLIVLNFHLVTYTIFRKGIVHGGSIALFYHLSAYVVVNLFLVFVAFFTSVPRWSFSPWFFWILGSWGLGLIFHLVVYFYIAPKKDEEESRSWLDRKVNQELEKLKRTQNVLLAKEKKQKSKK